MRLFIFVLFICSINSFTRYGIHFWTGKKISKRKFVIDIQKNFENDILTLFENKCNCLFDEKIQNLSQGDKIIVEYNQDDIIIYVNDNVITSQENSNTCFFCIQDNFK